MVQDAKKRNIERIVFLSIIVVLVIALAYTALNRQKVIEYRDRVVKERDSLKTETIDLEKELDEVNKIVISQKGRIRELDSIVAAQNEYIEKQKAQIRAQIQKGNLDKEQIKRLKEQIDQLKYYVEKYQNRIDSLVRENKVLKADLEKFKQDNEELKRKTIEKDDKIAELDIKVKTASILKAEDFKFSMIKENGKEDDDQPFKARKISKIKMRFTIAENKVADKGERTLYIVYINPDGSVSQDMNKGSGKIKTVDGEKTYSTSKTINYTQSAQEVSLVYANPVEYKPGNHTVEVYENGYLIGKGSFKVK
ncbi:MAG: Atg14 domain-containing protein [Bacteroidia bacterium]|nr:Atg14 domain-containing protein [Bacteroidia bacterium]MDW8302111.1 hypothetical protein [Bacteroidia bacterium]